MNDLFAQLCDALGQTPDSRGEAHIDCPYCGKEAKRGATHFSFSERGGFCFVCSGKVSLAGLADLLGLTGPASPVAPRPRRQPAARREPPKPDFDLLVAEYERNLSLTELARRWQAYRPIDVAAIIERRLGYGAFPPYTSKCQHERLMVPLLVDGLCLGLRGRSLGCDCGRWLSPSGTMSVLYNGAVAARANGLRPRLGDSPDPGSAAGRALLVFENPLDVLMQEALEPEFRSVATLGVTMWRDEYTTALLEQRPSAVYVCFDNDRPGNGGGEAGRQAWLREHKVDIEPNGLKLARRLQNAGLAAYLFEYPPETPLKTDAGDLWMVEYRSRKG